MPKRGYGDMLTGGSRDVNPQFLSFNAATSAADTTTTTTQALPIQRLPTMGRSQVMEILQVWFERPGLPAIASVTEIVDSMIIYLTTKSFGTTAIGGIGGESTVFAFDHFSSRGAFTAAGTYKDFEPRVATLNLTDGAGHGIIIATDNIFAQVQSAGIGAVITYGVKVMYRMKNVSLTEYIGVVQSQQ